MASVQDIYNEIDRIESAKGAIGDAIESKGVSVPIGTPIQGYAALVRAIQNNSFFWCEYGTTTRAEIAEALTSEMFPVVLHDSRVYVYHKTENSIVYFVTVLSDVSYRITVGENDAWNDVSVMLENSANKTTELSSESTDEQYPSAKAVFDSIPPVPLESVKLNGQALPIADKAVDVLVKSLCGAPLTGSGDVQQRVSVSAENPYLCFGMEDTYVALISAGAPMAIFHFSESGGLRLFDFSGRFEKVCSLGSKFGIKATGYSSANYLVTFLSGGAHEVVAGAYTGSGEPYVFPDSLIRYYSKPEGGIPASDLASGVIPDVSQFITKSVNDLTNYYLKSETYTRVEVQALIGAIQQFAYEIVSVLPAASAGTMMKIYLVPSSDPQTENVKDEYITIDNGAGAETRYTWELIGSTAIDLSGYVTTQALNTALADYQTLANLVASWGQTPSDSKYPSEKLVKDSLDNTNADLAQLDLQVNGLDINSTKEYPVNVDTYFYYWTDLIIKSGQKFRVKLSGTAEWPNTNKAWIISNLGAASSKALAFCNDPNGEYEITAPDDITSLGLRIYKPTTGGDVTMRLIVDGKENTVNKVTTLSSSSTDIQYPSAKAVYGFVMAKANESALINLSVSGAGTASDLIGAVITITDEDNAKTLLSATWQGQPVAVNIPSGIKYKVAVSRVPNYDAPDAVEYISVGGDARNITMTYAYNPTIDLSYVDVNGTPLPTQNTANSYVVKAAGLYKLPAIYGNAIKGGQTNTAAYTRQGSTYTADFVNYKGVQITSPYIETDTGETIQSAVLLWQTKQNLISNLAYANGYVTFTVNSIPAENALVVLAVKDSNGDIMWSWTLWLTTDSLTAETFTNHTDVEYDLMSEALFTIWNAQRTKACAAFLQWGRKDAIVPNEPQARVQMTVYDIDGNTITEGTALGSIIGVFGTNNDLNADKTVANTIKNPGMFFTSYDSLGNWNNLGWFNNFWNAAETASLSVSDNQDTAIKTIYDPCPVGWMLPAGRAFTGFTTTGENTTTSSEFNVVGAFNEGWNFKKNSNDAVGSRFEGLGSRLSSNAGFDGVGVGFYWTFAPKTQIEAYFLAFGPGNIYPLYYYNRAFGYSIRPSVEQD